MGQYTILGTGPDDASAVFRRAREVGFYDGLLVSARDDEPIVVFHDGHSDAQLEAGFVDFDPLDYQIEPLPAAIRLHAGHLRDYRDAVRAGTAVTTAQTTHVIADIIDWLRLDEDRL